MQAPTLPCPDEPTGVMLDAAHDCTPVTKDSPDFKVTARSIYVCMVAAWKQSAALVASPAPLIRQDLIDIGRERFQDVYCGDNHEGALVAAIEAALDASEQGIRSAVAHSQ